MHTGNFEAGTDRTLHTNSLLVTTDNFSNLYSELVFAFYARWILFLDIEFTVAHGHNLLVPKKVNLIELLRHPQLNTCITILAFPSYEQLLPSSPAERYTGCGISSVRLYFFSSCKMGTEFMPHPVESTSKYSYYP